jgi:LCP family protein required for cell wall assembly
MTDRSSKQATPKKKQTWCWPASNHKMPALAALSLRSGQALLLLVIVANTVAGCAPSTALHPVAPLGTGPVAALSPTATSPAPSSTPTWTALPTVAAAARKTVTVAPSFTPTQTVTPAYTPSLTPPPSATVTRTNTPQPPRPTITPTETITPTLTPTLTPTPMFSPTPQPTATYSGDVLHLLLIGLDSTKNLGGQNTDVIIVAAVNKDTKQVSMLSIPRDLWVYIPTYGWSRINVAHKIGHRTGYPGGGPGLLGETIRINLGIPTDHWIRVDFQGFARVVDALGGVDMTVACPVNLRYQPPASSEEQEMILEPGIYHMDGATALRYVRTRRGGSDFDRARRQQQFLKAMWDQTKSPDIILRIPALWSALSGSFQTDLDLGEVLSLAPLALDIKPQRIRSRYIGSNETRDWTNADGWQVLLPLPDKIQQTVASLYAPLSATEEQVSAEGARIQVRNGTYRQQLAQIGADQLRWHGFNIVDTGLADNPNYKETKIIVFSDKPQALDLLVRVLNVKPENVVRQPDPNQPADIQVILGEGYDPCR